MARNVETAKIIDSVLKTLVITGMAGSLIIAPNAVQLGDVALKKLEKRSRARQAAPLLNYLAKQQLVTVTQLPNGMLAATITQKGKKRALQADFDSLSIVKQKRWDAKWRLVMFDVAERKKAARRALSAKLRSLGFYQLQKSVWAHAYPCSVEIELVRQALEIGPEDITLVESDYLNREAELKRFFGL